MSDVEEDPVQSAMSDVEEDPAQSERPRMGPVLRGSAMVLLVIVASCFGGGLVRWIALVVSPPPPAPSELVEVRPTPSVIVAIRDLARLESASYHMERIIDLTSRQRRLFGFVEAEDTILLVAAADVVAGVDLSELSGESVVIDDDHVVITLPAAVVFSARLDNERTYVRLRQTDLLARRSEDLETRARREAERTLRDAAIEAGILPRAERNARRTVESLVRSLGLEDVEVRFADPE